MIKLSRALRLAATEGKTDVYQAVEGKPLGRKEEGDATGVRNVLKYLLAASEFYAPSTCSKLHDEDSKYWAPPFKIQLPRGHDVLYLCTPAIKTSFSQRNKGICY